jgi:PAS domain S-box-containing protein
MGDMIAAILATIVWTGTLILWLLLRAQGPAASIALKRYVGWKAMAWSFYNLIEILYFLEIDWTILGTSILGIEIVTHHTMRKLGFCALMAFAIGQFIHAILQPQKISAIPVAEAQIQIDAYGIVVAWDVEATKLFGWDAHDMLGHLLSDTIIPPRYRDAHTQGLTRFRATAQAPIKDQRLTFPALTKEKGEIVIEFRIKENLTSQGTIFTAIISPAVVLK